MLGGIMITEKHKTQIPSFIRYIFTPSECKNFFIIQECNAHVLALTFSFINKTQNSFFRLFVFINII